MRDPESPLLGLVISSYLLLLANVGIFATYSILGFNNGLVVNTLGVLTTNNVIFTYLSWTAIYMYQIIWVLYALALVIRRRPGDPVPISVIALGLYVLALVLQLVVNTVFLIEVSFPFLLVMFISLTISLNFSYRALYNNRFIIARQNLRTTDSLIRGLLQNGIDVYGFWVSLVAFLNLSVILETRTNPPLNMSIILTIILTLVIVIAVSVTIPDFTVFDKFTRYSLATLLFRVWIVSYLLTMISNVGLIIVGALLLAFSVSSVIGKITIIFLRRETRPVIPPLSDI